MFLPKKQLKGYTTVDHRQLEEIMRSPQVTNQKITGNRAKLRQSQNLQKILKMDFVETKKNR
jgi:hypothetical protein